MSAAIHIHGNLKRLRALRGYSQDIVAAAIEVKRSTLSGWENGASEPSLSHLVTLSEYYQVNLTTLVRTDLTTWPPSRIEELQRSNQLHEPQPNGL